MENVIVEKSTALIGISSLMKAAIPELHPGSVLRSARTVMKNLDGSGDHQLTPKVVEGRKTTMASLDTCKYILDNLPGHRWAMWRTTQGDSFKESLSQHVEHVLRESEVEVVGQFVNQVVDQVVDQLSGQAVDQAEDQVVGQAEDQYEDEAETKESTLKKALRTLDIDGSVRIDEASGKASILDTIRLLSPGLSSHGASQMLIRLLEKEDATEPRVCAFIETTSDDIETTSDSIASRIEYIQINGKGRSTPVSDAKTIVEIMWLLPTSAARSFRRQSAETICRVLGGDVSLCSEIERRCARLQNTPEGRTYQNFMVGDEPPAKRTRIGPEVMELASEEQYAKFVKIVLDNEMTKHKTECVKTEVSLVMRLKDAFEVISPLEARQKIELCDRISDIQRRAFRSLEEEIPCGPINAEAVVVAAPVPEQDPGYSVPTPQCSRGVRGEEISIAMIATEMGVSVGGRGGLVGKKLKALYAERYGQNAANDIPKRSTVFQGRPYQENSYFARDKDLVERAISIVVGN